MSLYVPSHFAMSDRAAIARLIHDYPFASLVTPCAPEPFVTHLPLLLVAGCEPHGMLLGHVARANPHWEQARDIESMAIFQGPHAYVSPSWYGEPAKAVPTWNFTAIHAHGALEIVDDPVETRGILDALVQRFEGDRETPWQFAMPERQRDALVGAIVAFRIRIRRITAKFKLSQNRPPADRVRVAKALEREPYADAASVAAWMRDYSIAPHNE
jgi:transcriptional regulator